jgi:hypothetical protein
MSSTLLRTLSKHSWNGEPIVVPPRAHPHNSFGDKHSAIDVHDSSTPVTELNTITFDASGLPFAPIQIATTAGSVSTINEAGGEKGKREKRKYQIVLAAIFWCLFTLGLNDGSTGPLLPVYQEYYGVRIIASKRRTKNSSPGLIDQLSDGFNDLYQQLHGMLRRYQRGFCY